MMKHILININDLYSQHCCVMLCSLFENNKGHKFRIHIFSFDISEKNRKLISDFAEKYGNEVNFYLLNDKGIRFPNIGSTHISREAYIRLFSPDFLPEDIDRVLYLDVDLLVMKDIEELYGTEMDDCVIAGIEDYPQDDRPGRLGIPAGCGYFNSGVMMINLKMWRKLNLTPAAKDILNNTKIELKHHDQDVLNMLCCNKWKRIPFRWNILDVFFYDMSAYRQIYQDEIKKDIQDPGIIHFSGIVKPWKAWSPHPYYNYYYYYLSRTPWKGFRPSLKTQWNSYKFPRNVLTVTKLDRVLVPLKKKIKEALK